MPQLSQADIEIENQGLDESDVEIQKPKGASPESSSYRTSLSPSEESGFQSWIKQNRVPYEDSPTADYDMRGLYKAKQSGDPIAAQAGNGHYPDKWKTPYHKTFSNESMYATPDAPHWENNRLIDKDGNVVADESSPTDLVNAELAKHGLSVSAPKTPQVRAQKVFNPIGSTLGDIIPGLDKSETPDEHAQAEQRRRAAATPYVKQAEAITEEQLEHPGELAGNAIYPGVGTAARGVSELATKGARVKGAIRTLSGVTEGLQPLVGPAAIENPVPVAVGMGTGTAASAGAGKVADALHAEPETKQLAEDLAFWAPQVIGAGVGLRTGEIDTPEVQGRSATILGGKAGAAVVNTPESFGASVKVGNTRVGVRIPKSATEVSQQAQLNEAVGAMTESHQAEAASAAAVNGVPPQPKPVITPDVITQKAEEVKSLPEEQQPEALVKSHQELTQALGEQGAAVVDGKVVPVSSPKEAAKVSADIINKEIKKEAELGEDDIEQVRRGAPPQSVEVPAVNQVPKEQRASNQIVNEAQEKAAGRIEGRTESKKELSIGDVVTLPTGQSGEVARIPAEGKRVQVKLPDGKLRWTMADSLAAQGPEASAEAARAHGIEPTHEQVQSDRKTQADSMRMYLEEIAEHDPELSKQISEAHPEVKKLLEEFPAEASNEVSHEPRGNEGPLRQTAPGFEAEVRESSQGAESAVPEKPTTRLNATKFRQQLDRVPNVTPEQKDATVALLEANAKYLGIPLDDYIGKHIAGVSTGQRPVGNVLHQSSTPTFISKAEEVAKAKLPNHGTGEAFLRTLKNNGVKDEELKWSGLDDLLSKKLVSRQAVLDHMRQNSIQVRDVVKGSQNDQELADKATAAYIRFYDVAQEELGIQANTVAEQIHHGNRGSYEIIHEYTKTPSTDLLMAGRDLFNATQDARAGEETTKFSSYQLPGGKNYRELLLTLPEGESRNLFSVRGKDGNYYGDFTTRAEAEHWAASRNQQNRGMGAHVVERTKPSKSDFRGGHFDEPNVLAHVRFNDRISPDGKKTLFIEEIQSDWHQKGRKQGYADSGRIAELEREMEQLRAKSRQHPEGLLVADPGASERVARVSDELNRLRKSQVPDAPFKSTWHELALKRVLRYAAEKGYDRIAWTTGEQQAARYDLSKQIKNLDVEVIGGPGEKQYVMTATGNDGSLHNLGATTADKLPDVIGKDLAAKIIASPGKLQTYSGLDLKVGGQGMKGFYDKIIPDFLNKYGKQWGARVGQTDIQLGEDEKAFREAERSGNSEQMADALGKKVKAHSLDITPSMKKSVMEEGLYLFQDKAKGAVEFLEDGRALIHAFEKADISTLVHESAHIFRRTMKPDEMKIAAGWLGVKDGQWSADQEEKFARGFEQYLKDGKAPNSKLRDLFAKFKQWLSDIYGKIVRGAPSLSKEARNLYDAILGGEEPESGSAEIAPGKTGELATSQIRQAPFRFQYKLNTDAEGVGQLLKGQSNYNPDLAGVISVWKDPADGQYYVVNGHHRLELAKRTGQPTVTVRHIVAKDASEARATGALQNIAEGRGTPIDAAKFLRDTGITPEDLERKGISMGEATAAKAVALAKLEPSLWSKVVQEQLPVERAIAIAESTSDHAEQKAIVDLIDRKERQGKRITNETLRELVRFVKGSQQSEETTLGLFGSETIAKSHAIEKAEVSAYIKQQLAKDKKLFVSKGERAEELERGNNIIDVKTSQRIAQEATQGEEVYNKLSERAGPISDVLDDAAARIAGGENPNAVKQEAYQDVKHELSQALPGGQRTSAAEREGRAKREYSVGGSEETAGYRQRREHGNIEPLTDDELASWAKSRSLKIEEAGEQGSLFGNAEKMYRVSRIGSDGERQSALVPESKLEKLRETNARVAKHVDQGSLFGAPERIVPGARSAFTGNETQQNSIQSLTESIANNTPKMSLKNRIYKGAEIGQRGSPGNSVTGILGRLKGGFAALVDAWQRPPKWGDYEDATGKWSGADQASALDLYRFTKAIKEAVPDKVKREAISNWIEAGGDDQVLKECADKSQTPYKAGYEAALKLTDEEKTIARNVMNLHDATLQEAIHAGIVEQGVENYIQHIYKDSPKFQAKIAAEMNFNSLQTKPSFSKKRVLPTYFDAEQLGFTPKDKDVGFLTSVHERSLREALAARSYIKSLMEGKASDGRPLVATSWASARPMGDEGSAYAIKPNIKPSEEYADYKTIDHPALRKWKWSANIDGKDVFVQGEAVVHPEVYRKIKNNLSRSAIRTYEIEVAGKTIRPGDLALNLQAEAKHTILSFSGFHQTTLGLHALEHKTMPAGMPELDLNVKDQRELVDHGLMVAHYDAMEEFGEGVASGGIVTKIPGIGPLYKTYVDYLFKSYLPRVKMQMGLNALGRNKERYPDLNPDQIYAITAKQANAAFGGLNYRMLGRNKTFQDTLRLLMMAPDFTEARARFVGQSVKPWGREQLMALLGGAMVLYTTARILNEMLDKKPHWDKPFGVIYRHKEYGLRTIQGDLLNLVEDPKKFFINRLSPFIAAAVHEDDPHFQKKHESIWQKVERKAESNVPIPLQPWMRNNHDSPAEKTVESILKMVGVNVKSAKAKHVH